MAAAAAAVVAVAVDIHDCFSPLNSSLSPLPPPPLPLMAEVDIHDCLYVCIGDGGDPERYADTCDRVGSHWVAFHFPLVGPAKFFDSLGNAPNTYHHRFANVMIVNGQNNTTVRLESSTTTPTPADCIACTTSNGYIEEWSCRT